MFFFALQYYFDFVCVLSFLQLVATVITLKIYMAV